MQSILFLKSSEDGEIERLINIDLLSTAHPDPKNPERTRIICGLADMTIDMPFSKFLKQVEHLIQENYRVSVETSAQWHKKKMEDMEKTMKSVLQVS